MSGLWIALRPAARSLAGASMWKATSSIAAPAMTSTIVRKYAAAHGLSRQDIEGRILEVLKSFDKVDGAKVSATAHFMNDLGLDSLDTVELVMAFEEEFGLDIPDADAEKIFTAEDAIQYVLAQQ